MAAGSEARKYDKKPSRDQASTCVDKLTPSSAGPISYGSTFPPSHAFPMPGVLKGKKGRPPTQSSISTAARQRNPGSQTPVPSFPPSHWVNPYRNCNMEKTKAIDNWIMDAFNMTFEAEHMTRDHPARRGLGTDQKYLVRCADNGQEQCPPNTWLAVDIPGHAVCICSDMFNHETAKERNTEQFSRQITLASKPFDDSEDGWCRPPPHDLDLYVLSARALLSRMIRIRLQTVEDYREGDLRIWTSARNLKSDYTTSLAQWKQSDPRRRGDPPRSPLSNPESYVGSIVGDYSRSLAPSIFT
ncbi:hypothetical protein GG344DRAFT_66651 [Lentinula edodes]|nr:hypothetical protein GG344DRAFT_66651 [Lentinula edodes]